MNEDASRPRLTWKAGGGVLLLGVVLTLLAMARVLWPVLSGPKSHAIGDGRSVESYGFDLSNLLVSREELTAGGMPRDGIPVLDAPPLIDAAQVLALARKGRAKYLVSSDRVIGVRLNGASRCYPILAVQWHEVVNDTLGGVPIAVTYNPLCDAAVVFDRRVAGRLTRFGASGLLWNSNLVLYDRDTAAPTLFSQLQARAIAGPLAADACSLQVLRSAVLPWGDWHRIAPETTCLARTDVYYDRYRRQPYAPYFGDDRLRFAVRPLPPAGPHRLKSPCLVLRTRDATIVAPVSSLLARAEAAGTATAAGGTTEVTIEGKPIPIHLSREPEAAWIEPDQELARGTAVFAAFWFAWYAQHPESRFLDSGLRAGG